MDRFGGGNISFWGLYPIICLVLELRSIVDIDHPVYLSMENVENWYPKTFSDRIDMILLYIFSRTNYMGEVVTLVQEEMFSCLY